MWVVTFILGAFIYTKYRIYIRIPIEQASFWKTQGFFELKEHFASFGLGILPIYWYFWKNAKTRNMMGREVPRPSCSASCAGSSSCRPGGQQCAGIRIMSTTSSDAPATAAATPSAKFETFAIVFGLAYT